MCKSAEILNLAALALIGVCGVSISKGATPGDFWYFGINAGLDFSGGAPVAVTDGQILTVEGSAAVSDPDGNLLFYTDGTSVYDRSHTKMDPSGHSLNGDSDSTQSAIVIPKPGDVDIFYIFTVPPVNDASGGGLDYYEVDMSGNSGLGTLDTSSIRLVTNVSEQLTAVKHNNGTDYWVIARIRNSNEFHAYQVSATGVDTTPVVSAVGTALSGTNQAEIGYLKASPDGSKLAMALLSVENAELFNFNNSSGELSNPVTLNPSGEQHYGIEFSPDGTKLYVGASTLTAEIIQYDLLAGSGADIINSSTIIGNASAPTGGLQIGPDGKIYIAPVGEMSLDVIAAPNEPAASVDLQNGAVSLGTGMAMQGLPTFAQSFFVAANNRPTSSDTTLEMPWGTNHSFAASDFPFTDADGDSLHHIRVESLPSLGTFQLDGTDVSALQEIALSDLIKLSYEPVALTVGSPYASFQYKVHDGKEYSEASYILTINVTNTNPVLDTSIPDQIATEDIPYSYTFPANTFSDSDAADSLAYTASRSDGSVLPSWLTFDGASRTFYGTPTNDDVGTFTLRVTATDQFTGEATDEFRMTVLNANDDPFFTSTAVTLVDALSSYSYDVSAEDIDIGDTLVLSGSTMPSWLTLDDNGDGTASLTGTPSNLDAGTNTVVLQVSDGTSIVDQSFDITVTLVITEPSVIVISTEINGQTGLMDQTLRVENLTGTDIDAFRITFRDLKDVQNLYNRTGTDEDGNPYVEIPETLTSGESTDVRVSYLPNVHSLRSEPANLSVESIDINTIWEGAANIGDGWLQLDWFDLFNAEKYPWVYHPTLEWIYLLGNDADHLWMWKPDLGWYWTSQEVYPNIYLANENAWAWLQTGNDTAQLYNYQTGTWEILAE